MPGGKALEHMTLSREHLRDLLWVERALQGGLARGIGQACWAGLGAPGGCCCCVLRCPTLALPSLPATDRRAGSKAPEAAGLSVVRGALVRCESKSRHNFYQLAAATELKQRDPATWRLRLEGENRLPPPEKWPLSS